MTIYGTALLSLFCSLGCRVGRCAGPDTDVGGLGIAMGKVTKPAVKALF